MLTLQFDGNLLRRGFWLYVWRVSGAGKTVLYVGRTGDSSSRFAASPFNRAGQHLDLRPSAQANMLTRQLRSTGLEPEICQFELFAHGPLFEEQSSLELHRVYRDKVAPLETGLAEWLKQNGHIVIGTHGSRLEPDADLLAECIEKFRGALDRYEEYLY